MVKMSVGSSKTGSHVCPTITPWRYMMMSCQVSKGLPPQINLQSIPMMQMTLLLCILHVCTSLTVAVRLVTIHAGELL